MPVGNDSKVNGLEASSAKSISNLPNMCGIHYCRVHRVDVGPAIVKMQLPSQLPSYRDSVEDERYFDQIMEDRKAAEVELYSRDGRASNCTKLPQLLHD
ncbi:hypothetical protein KIW84_044604 [Lathyrus oleraceus]|uniref:Uncharacterized protein n=1 Tax=Pisum sativum TaxID=3888 RepID=A0A9D4XGP0_PEA|nr:hypothetical protein KIW84_044604 [Pisum sativum]